MKVLGFDDFYLRIQPKVKGSMPFWLTSILKDIVMSAPSDPRAPRSLQVGRPRVVTADVQDVTTDRIPPSNNSPQPFNHRKFIKRVLGALAIFGAGTAVAYHLTQRSHHALIQAEKEKFVTVGPETLRNFALTRDFPQWTSPFAANHPQTVRDQITTIPGTTISAVITPLPALRDSSGWTSPMTRDVYAQLDRLRIVPTPKAREEGCALFGFSTTFTHEGQRPNITTPFGTFNIVVCKNGSDRVILNGTDVLNTPAAFDASFQATMCNNFRVGDLSRDRNTAAPSRYTHTCYKPS